MCFFVMYGAQPDDVEGFGVVFVVPVGVLFSTGFARQPDDSSCLDGPHHLSDCRDLLWMVFPPLCLVLILLTVFAHLECSSEASLVLDLVPSLPFWVDVPVLDGGVAE